MSTAMLDPGRTTRTVEPHPGDKAAQWIGAALERAKAQAAIR